MVSSNSLSLPIRWLANRLFLAASSPKINSKLLSRRKVMLTVALALRMLASEAISERMRAWLKQTARL